MKKLCCMIALAAISFSSVYAAVPVKGYTMKTDTAKKKKKVKMKSDTGKMKVKTKMKKDTTKM